MGLNYQGSCGGEKPLLNIVMFYHSVISDWNNGNAHFLRGVVRELCDLGNHVVVYEPRDAWSMQNLEAVAGDEAERQFSQTFPEINFVRYSPEHLQLDEVLDKADLVLVHEWNDHSLVAAIGRHRARHHHYKLLFHDTHHRSVTCPETMAAYDLTHYDGVLAFGAVVRDLYLEKSWTQHAWTWHEAADTQLFYPRESPQQQSDVLWIGNWGDEERTRELHDYFFEPVRELQLKCSAYGVRYPQEALEVLDRSGIYYGGWLPNYRVPEKAAEFRAMVHIPRRPYVEALPGIPTIRPFEAMACGIPLICSYWNDSENMFTEGQDYLMARNPGEMKQHMENVLHDRHLAGKLASHALKTIQSRHTCRHRAQELLGIFNEIQWPQAQEIEPSWTAVRA